MTRAIGIEDRPRQLRQEDAGNQYGAADDRNGRHTVQRTHSAPDAAVKNSAAAMSDVTSGPCASIVGLNTNEYKAHPRAGRRHESSGPREDQDSQRHADERHHRPAAPEHGVGIIATQVQELVADHVDVREAHAG